MNSNILITDRDGLLLDFLWRFKVATTATLVKKFFPNSLAPITGYKRLLKLKKKRFIQIRCENRSTDFVWMLDVNGYKKIKSYVGKIIRPGYAPESISHDLLGSALQLGDWFLGFPEGVEVLTEQELKRLDPSIYPDWLQRKLLRIPDGFWYIPKMGKTAVIALEVEINQKSIEEYQKIAQIYGNESFYRVLWVTSTERLARKIASTIQNAVPTKPFNHNFVTLSEFKKLGWQAPIIVGPDKERTIAKLLGAERENSSKVDSMSFLLDGRKFPFKSKTFIEKMALAESNY